VCALKRGDLFAFVRDEPAIAVRWLWPLLGILADRLDTSSRALSRAREELEAEDISDAIDAEEENSGRSSNPPTVRISAETSEALAAGSLGVDSGELEELDVEADGAPTQARPVVLPSDARREDDAPESSAPTVGRPILAPTHAETVISVAGTSPTPKVEDGTDEEPPGAPLGDPPISEASAPDPATDPSGGAQRPRRMLSVTLPSSAFRDALLASDEKPKT
jgi:hypothetical protein